MKKLVAILVVLSTITLTLKAQSPVHFGLKGGTYYSEFSGVGKSALGYLGGVFVRIDLPKKFVVQPEVYYSLKRGEVSGVDDYIEKSDLDIALLGGYRVIDNTLFNFRLMAGVVNSVNLDKQDGLGSFEANSLGYSAGLGFDVTKLTFDVRYESSFGDVAPGTKFSGFQLALGFKFI